MSHRCRLGGSPRVAGLRLEVRYEADVHDETAGKRATFSRL